MVNVGIYGIYVVYGVYDIYDVYSVYMILIHNLYGADNRNTLFFL